MSAENRAELWEDEDKRFQAYMHATDEERLDMRREYEQYINEKYPVGTVAIQASVSETQLQES